MAEELVPIQENEYKELLLQTVAVIERARINVARRIATTASNTYWEIGRLLHEKKMESKHGSGVVKRLSVDLRERYPDMGLSPRQLWNMKSFYVRYKDCDEKLLRSVALLPWSQTNSSSPRKNCRRPLQQKSSHLRTNMQRTKQMSRSEVVRPSLVYRRQSCE